MVIDQKWFCSNGIIKSGAPIEIRQQNFINKAIEKHGDRYDYSITKYTKSSEKVDIICKEHGPFKQLAGDHLKGANCPVCGKLSRKASMTYTLEEFINKAKSVHGDTYSYTEVLTYTNNKTEVPIVCNIHGIFTQTPDVHLRGCGCPKCGDRAKNKDRTDTSESFIEKARTVHGDRYNYSSVEYINAHTNVTIICSKHGDFLQKPCSHLYGKSGCPICAKESYIADVSTRGLYIMYSATLDTYKIGITNNIHKRLLKLNRSGEHFSLVNFYDLNSNEHSMKLEKYLHQYFKTKQCTDFLNTDLDGKTELFHLNEDDINYIDSYIKSYCKNIGVNVE